jgi:HEXXH motif-containing protein
VTPAGLLWNDTRIYRRRYAKSAAALVATARALARHRPLAGRETEFLGLYRTTVAADPRRFTAVWLDPTAYFWVRMAYQLTATCLTGSPLPPLARDYCADVGAARADAALALHLDGFKRFVLGLRLGSRGPLRFARPLAVGLPFAIPATGLSLVGDGGVRIHALRGRRLDVERNGARATIALVAAGGGVDGLDVVRCPTLAAPGVDVVLQPHALDLPGLGFARGAARQPLAFQAAHAPLVDEALRLVRRHHPRAYAHFGRLMRLLVLKPAKLGDYSNLTHSDLPGAAICSLAPDPYEMADTLIHELHHNRLFFIEERTGPFFRDATASVLTRRYYSPWRDDLRPLHGLFHALYVYLPVAWFWLAVHRSGEIDARRRGYVIDRVLRIAAQLHVGAAVLRRHAELTRTGAALLGGMEREVRAVVRAVRALRLPGDSPALKLEPDGSLVPECDEATGRPLTVDEAVTAHIARYDADGQCAEVAPVRGLFLDAASGTGVHGARRTKRAPPS